MNSLPAVSKSHDEHAAEISLLLVEDSATDAKAMMAALAEPGGSVEVRWVKSVAAACSALSSENFDGVIVGLASSHDAVHIVEVLEGAAGEAPVIVCVSATEDDLHTHPGELIADDCLLKSEITAHRIRRWLDREAGRRESVALLAEMSARSEAVLAALAEGVVVLDADARVTSVNPAAEIMLGVSGQELLGRHITAAPLSLVDADGVPVPDAARASYRTLESGDAVSGLLNGVQGMNGEVTWVEVNTQPLPPRDGRAGGVVISMRRVDERRAAEEATRFQAALLDAIGQAVVVTDAHGRVVFWNPAAAAMHGWTAEEAVGRLATDFVAPGSDQLAQDIGQALAAGQPWTGDFMIRRRDGSQFSALVTDTPVFDGLGRLVAIVGVATDISERISAEQASQALAAIVESTGDAIFTKSLSGIILTWNRGAEDLYGFSKQDAVGHHVTLLSPRDHDDEIEQVLAAVSAGETVRGLETVRCRRDGTSLDVSLTISPILDAKGKVTSASVIARDISDRRQLERELVRQAMEDSLTGLPNRTLLADRMAQALAGSGRRGVSVAVLFLDLDNFKTVNDSSGHLVGDELLVEVSRRLKVIMRPADTVARFGGDEFVIVCEDSDAEVAQGVAARIAQDLSAPIVVGGRRFYVTASIGIAVSPPLAADSDVLLRYADAAMYEAKAAGRSQSRLFDVSMATKAAERLDLTNDLRDALAGDLLAVHYQPVVELTTSRVVGVEARVRWQHEARGWLQPEVFVPLAEEGGFGPALDRWVLGRACRDMATLRAWGLLAPDVRLAVSLSAEGVLDPVLADAVSDIAAQARLPLSAIELEVSETALLTNAPIARRTLRALRELGVNVALDDFGTGHSAFTSIRELPATTIKIDRTFISDIVASPEDLAIVTSVIDLARVVGLKTIAEGVETAEQVALLQRLGCMAGQGYFWSKELTRDDLAALLREHPSGLALADPSNGPLAGGRARKAVTNEHGLHRIVEMHRAGVSPTTIAAALNAEEFHTPHGVRWHTATVAGVIRDVV